MQHVIQGCHLNCCPACMYLLPLYAWEFRSRTHRLKSACLPASGGTWNIICQHRATCVAVSLQTTCLLWESLPNINKARGGRRAEGSGRGCLSIVMRPPPQMVSELDASSRLCIWQHINVVALLVRLAGNMTAVNLAAHTGQHCKNWASMRSHYSSD